MNACGTDCYLLGSYSSVVDVERSISELYMCQIRGVAPAQVLRKSCIVAKQMVLWYHHKLWFSARKYFGLYDRIEDCFKV